jgi:LPS-assembly lipoprotein
MSLTRRRILFAGTLLPLAGCGFQPVYMSTASGKAGPAARELAAISVRPIPDRQGQILRQALQERFHDDDGTPLLYDLGVNFTVSGDAIGIRTDNIATRVRVIGTARYVLVTKDADGKQVTSGSARATDDYNIIDEQYFAADLENQAVLKRVAELLADQVAIQLATFFRKRAAA